MRTSVRLMDRDRLAAFLAEGLSLEQIGVLVDRHPSTVGYWVKKHGLTAAHRDRHLGRGGIDRAALEQLIADGSSMRQMAEALGVSAATIRHWLTNYGLRTAAAERRRQSRAARRARSRVAVMKCGQHGETEFFLDATGRYRCGACRSAHVVKRRKKLKTILVAEAGGSCCLCGYDRHVGALHFHHLDPDEKRFSLGERGLTRSLHACRTEAAKCVLLCANCHAEVESGLVSVSVELRLAGPT
jgi:ribosomal protein L30E